MFENVKEFSSINMSLSGSPEMHYGWDNKLVMKLFGENSRVCSELYVLHTDDITKFLSATGRLESDYAGKVLHIVSLMKIGGNVFYDFGQGSTKPIPLEVPGPRVVIAVG